jgi:hypothetical protein
MTNFAKCTKVNNAHLKQSDFLSAGRYLRQPRLGCGRRASNLTRDELNAPRILHPYYYGVFAGTPVATSRRKTAPC